MEKSERNRRIADWNKLNTVKKSVSFNKNKKADIELLEYIEVATQDISFNEWVKNLIREEGGFLG